MSFGSSHLNIGGRVNPEHYNNQGSALHKSLVQANMIPNAQQPYPVYGLDEFSSLKGQPSIDAIKNVDSADQFNSGWAGSPLNDPRLPISPLATSLQRGMNIRDVPLPASLDSNDISWFARHGPVAASVPSKFGMDSPPQSLPYNAAPTSGALKSLYDSAYGKDEQRIGHSPPTGPDEGYGQRIMHSQRISRPKMMSASVPRQGANNDWDADFAFEEDFLPGSLHDLLTPQEKMRRLSRTEDDVNMAGRRLSFGGNGTPGDGSSKVGSPTTSSPSRFGPLFTRYKREEDMTSQNNPVQNTGLGHVGSPLRNSSLHAGASPNLRAVSRPKSGDVSPYFASPPRQSSISGLGGLSQQLQRTRLTRNDSNESSGMYQNTNSLAQKLSNNGRMGDRSLSAQSLGSSGRNVTSIDEAKEDEFVFSMEEEEESSKRNSGGWNYPVGGRSPGFSGLGARTNGTDAGKDPKEYLREMGSLYSSGR
jgi:hypothetical protein